MLKKLIQPRVFDFIMEHQANSLAELDRLLLNQNKHPEIPMKQVVEQIKARQKAEKKIPLWYTTPGVLMPSVLAVEQCSSQATAEYKFYLHKGEIALDLTGGLGVDSFYLSKNYKEVIYIERSRDMAAIAAHNFKLLGANNIKVVQANSIDYLEKLEEEVDLIYVDPARRKQQQKVIQFKDCEPNIVPLQKKLFEHSNIIIVKASPMLDTRLAASQLKHVTQVLVVGINNEVKELLFYQNTLDQLPGVRLEATDLAKNFIFFTTLYARPKAPVSEAQMYLYEPNAAILKTGKQDELYKKYGVHKLNPNTQLYTSTQLIPNFPGRIFRTNKVVKYNNKEIIKHIGRPKANVAVRNFPDTVEEFRTKTKIKPGGAVYLFGIRDWQEEVKVLICSKI